MVPGGDCFGHLSITTAVISSIVDDYFVHMATTRREAPEGVDETRNVQVVDQFEMNGARAMTRVEDDPSLDSRTTLLDVERSEYVASSHEKWVLTRTHPAQR